MSTIVLKLFVMGHSPKSQRAVSDLRQLFDERFNGAYELNVIDIRARPQEAETDRVLATPTLVREKPLPVRRLIGDLSDAQQILAGLELVPGQEGDADVTS